MSEQSIADLAQRLRAADPDRGKDRETRRHVARWRQIKAKSEGRKKKK